MLTLCYRKATDPREADRGEIRGWQEFPVGWGTLHDQGTEGAHHARVARFLHGNQI
jgi:hypothetical protein